MNNRIESAREILQSFVTPERALNIAIANVRNPNSLGDLLKASVNRYQALTDKIERLQAELAIYDLEPKKHKVSKRVAIVPKYARSITK